MPRDISANHPGYVKIVDTLPVNPFPERKKEKKKRKKGEVDRGPENIALEANERGFRVFEMGNYPLVNHGALVEGAEADFRPKNYHWRMKLPADADWEPKDPDKDENREEKKKKKRR